MSVAFPPTEDFLYFLIWKVLEELQEAKHTRTPTKEQLLRLHEDEGMLIQAIKKAPLMDEALVEQRDEAIVGFMHEQQRTRLRYEKLYGPMAAKVS